MNEPRLPRERYQLLGLLGTGGMASVWRVLDVRLNVERAVKVLPQGVLHEAQLAARLAHPHVISIHDVLDLPDGTGVVMELAQGSLEDRVVTDGPLPVRAAARVMADVCDALDAAHALGIVHRDVKPANLLVCESGAGGPRVKLADFGIAGLLEADAPAESTRALLGSLPYMAPEQRRGEAGAASDVYGAAVTLAWLVTGALPGDLYVDEVRSGLRARLDAEDGDALVALLARAGAHDPAARPDAATLRDALRELAGDAVVRIGPLTRGPAPQARSGRWVRVGEGESVGPAGARAGAWSARAAWGVAVLALGVGVGGGVWVIAPRTADVVPMAEWWSLKVCDGYPPLPVTYRTPKSSLEPPGLREAIAPTIADLDQDGNVDYIVSHKADSVVRVWWGPLRTSRGWLEAHTDFSMGRARHAATVGDADGDGYLDLILTLEERGGIAIQRMVKRTTAGSVVIIDEGNDPSRAEVLDWDRDGVPDLSFVMQSASALIVRRGEGALSFGPPLEVALGVAGVLAVRGEQLLNVEGSEIFERKVGSRMSRKLAHTPFTVVEGISSDSARPLVVWGSLPLGRGAIQFNSIEPCRLPVEPHTGAAVAWLDDDATADYAFVRSCAYCTSSYEIQTSR